MSQFKAAKRSLSLFKYALGHHRHLVDEETIKTEVVYNADKIRFENSKGEELFGVAKCEVAISRKNAMALDNIPILPCKVFDGLKDDKKHMLIF